MYTKFMGVFSKDLVQIILILQDNSRKSNRCDLQKNEGEREMWNKCERKILERWILQQEIILTLCKFHIYGIF